MLSVKKYFIGAMFTLFVSAIGASAKSIMDVQVLKTEIRYQEKSLSRIETKVDEIKNYLIKKKQE